MAIRHQCIPHAMCYGQSRMADLEFDPAERYVIAYYKGESAGTQWSVWLIHACMAALFGYGIYTDDQALPFAAFCILILWRIYEQSHQPRYFRATRGVIEKYEARLRELTEAPNRVE